jgi:hypothetical protein
MRLDMAAGAAVGGAMDKVVCKPQCFHACVVACLMDLVVSARLKWTHVIVAHLLTICNLVPGCRLTGANLNM